MLPVNKKNIEEYSEILYYLFIYLMDKKMKIKNTSINKAAASCIVPILLLFLQVSSCDIFTETDTLWDENYYNSVIAEYNYFQENGFTAAAVYNTSIYLINNGTLWNYPNKSIISHNVSKVYADYSNLLYIDFDDNLYVVSSYYDFFNHSSETEPYMQNVSSASTGSKFSLILKNDNTLWAIGDNECGQLGTGDCNDVSTPVQVMTGVADISTGGHHSLILKTNNTLWVTGDNSYGQLGTGASNDVSTPVQVMTDVADILTGWYHSLIIKTDNTLWATGNNYYGQLGTGNFNGVFTPVQVMTEVADISIYDYHSLIIKTDNTLWATGDNHYGQLGTGDYNNVSTPVQVMTGVADITTGSCLSLILKTDNTLWAAGGLYFYNFPFPLQEIMTDVKSMCIGSRLVIIRQDGTAWIHNSNICKQITPDLPDFLE